MHGLKSLLAVVDVELNQLEERVELFLAAPLVARLHGIDESLEKDEVGGDPPPELANVSQPILFAVIVDEGLQGRSTGIDNELSSGAFA